MIKKMFTEKEHSPESLLSAAQSLERIATSYRESAFKRFPALFTLLVALGVSATYFGVEQLMLQVPWLIARPWLILVIGISILFFTGRLYKKLG